MTGPSQIEIVACAHGSCMFKFLVLGYNRTFAFHFLNYFNNNCFCFNFKFFETRKQTIHQTKAMDVSNFSSFLLIIFFFFVLETSTIATKKANSFVLCLILKTQYWFYLILFFSCNHTSYTSDRILTV